MDLTPFRIERYYARHECTTRYMLSSSYRESRTIGELLALVSQWQRRYEHRWAHDVDALEQLIRPNHQAHEPKPRPRGRHVCRSLIVMRKRRSRGG